VIPATLTCVVNRVSCPFTIFNWTTVEVMFCNDIYCGIQKALQAYRNQLIKRCYASDSAFKIVNNTPLNVECKFCWLYQLGRGFFVHHRKVSAVKRVEIVSIGM